MNTPALDKSDPRIAALVAEYEAERVDRAETTERWLDTLSDDEFYAVSARWFGAHK